MDIPQDVLDQMNMESERMRAVIIRLSLHIGILRGLILGFEDQLKPCQRSSLEGVDNCIEKLFYKGEIR